MNAIPRSLVRTLLGAFSIASVGLLGCSRDCSRTLSIDYIGDLRAPADFDRVVVEVLDADGRRSQQSADVVGTFDRQGEVIRLTELRNGAQLHIEFRLGPSVVFSQEHGPLQDVEAACTGRRVLPIAVVSHLPTSMGE